MAHSEKFELTRLPPTALRVLADVMQEDGDAKYQRWDWLEKSSQADLDAALRHLSKAQVGEWLDPISKRPHVAHAALRLLMILERDERCMEHDFDFIEGLHGESKEPLPASEPDSPVADEDLPLRKEGEAYVGEGDQGC